MIAAKMEIIVLCLTFFNLGIALMLAWKINFGAELWIHALH